MDELGFNKLAAAVLATALGYMGIKEISHMVMHVSTPIAPAYALDIPDVSTGGAVEIEPPFPSLEWVSAMDETRGERVFKKCQSCHNAEDGGANGTGPNLWNVVGATAGQHAGFKYSSAMANSSIDWNYEELDGFLKKPSKYLSGTNMNFIGLKKAEDRAAVVEYLRVHADAPIARPEPAPLPGIVEAEVMVPDSTEDMITEDMITEGTVTEDTVVEQ